MNESWCTFCGEWRTKACADPRKAEWDRLRQQVNREHAERYLWLRKTAPYELLKIAFAHGAYHIGGDCDAAIDAAIELAGPKSTVRSAEVCRSRCADCHEPTGNAAVCETCAGLRCESVAGAVAERLRGREPKE